MIGVNFQPGAQGENGLQNGSRPGGVQEAIKVLSLRLPKVVGAQSAVPQALLTSQGSGGNPRVDSVVNQVMQRFAPEQGGAPSGSYAAPQASMPDTPFQPMSNPWAPQPSQPHTSGTPPRIVVENGLYSPPRWPGQPQLDGGGGFPAMIGELPPNFAPPPSPPQLPEDIFGWMRRDQPSAPDVSPYEQPLL